MNTVRITGEKIRKIYIYLPNTLLEKNIPRGIKYVHLYKKEDG